MILGSHNSWTYLSCRTWWMRLFSFMARCQEVDIKTLYLSYDTRCFDLRVKFKGDELIVAHGMAEYSIDKEGLFQHLEWLNSQSDFVAIRVLHEARKKKNYTDENVARFKELCKELENTFKNLHFWCGRNLYNWEYDYDFPYKPSCDEKYSSVCPPKWIDDWYPKWFAKKNNQNIKEQGTDKDILLIDFVDL